MSDLKRCETCAHWREVEGEQFGTCRNPKFLYTFTKHGGMAPEPDGAMIEFDEEWGAFFGRKFGCIHHKEKA